MTARHLRDFLNKSVPEERPEEADGQRVFFTCDNDTAVVTGVHLDSEGDVVLEWEWARLV